MSDITNKKQDATLESLSYDIRILSEENRELRKLLENEIADKLSTSQALRYRHAKEDAFINSVPWIVFWVNRELCYLEVNRSFAETLKLPSESLMDKKVGTCNESPELINSLTAFSRSDDKTRIEEIKIQNEDKFLYYLCIMHKNDYIKNFSFVGIDITEKKNINKLLEIKTEELERILYVSSHDLKTPIQSIANLANWLEEDLAEKMTDESKDFLSLIKKRVFRMDEILNSLLKYHSIKLTEDSVSEFNFKKDITFLFSNYSKDHQSSKLIFIPHDLPLMKTPREHLMYILEALMSNSFKHNPESNIVLEISFQKLKDYYCFKVRDNGIGISPKFHDKVFEAFQTLKTKDEVEGCGMGLTIAKRIVETYNGVIFINPEYKAGTEINFTWPLEVS